MTYYGRWTYKYEEAERQGAAACLIVHEDDAAGYGWIVVNQSWGRPQLQLAAARALRTPGSGAGSPSTPRGRCSRRPAPTWAR